MHQTVQPKGWPRPKGYSNGVVAQGKTVYVAGQVGWNAKEVFESDDFVAQTEAALANIVAVLAEAGARSEHLVRMTWWVVDKSEYLDRLTEIGAAYKRVIGAVYPAMSLVQVAGLVEAGAKVEIEATAVIPT
ncbi:MAG: RidA family protein [Roseiarcus sp.]|jgi:enamine deaminase RidA (YjgF/YER057c/UK114 family)